MACLGLDSEASCGPMAPATRTSRHRWGRGRNKACLLVSYRPLASRACSGGAAAVAYLRTHCNRIAHAGLYRSSDHQHEYHHR